MKYEKTIVKTLLIIIAITMIMLASKLFHLVCIKLKITSPINMRWLQFPYCPFVWLSFSLVFFLSFIFWKTVDLRNKSIICAFFLSLLFEMFGIAFSMFIFYALFSAGWGGITSRHEYFIRDAWRLPQIITLPALLILLTLGIYLVMEGWSKIWVAKGALVSDGIYAFSRHPQYLGLEIILFSNLLYFPTPLLICLFIVISFMYYRLAKKEEKIMELRFAERYKEYKKRTPMFIPYKLKKKAIIFLVPGWFLQVYSQCLHSYSSLYINGYC